ncbi:MAG: hypothetical protein AB7O43_14505 [Hyphomicrobiaceae bacterium]
MAVFLSHPLFLTTAFGANHPLSIPRHSALVSLCEALDLTGPGEVQACPLATMDTLTRFHDPAYLAALEAASRTHSASAYVRQRYNLGSLECPIFEGLWERARATVGGAVLASHLALDGDVPFHPAGGTHHGRPDRASGFCYLNDPVFAILTLLDAGLGRILYADLDAHHGDGVEDAFAGDARVFSISIHEAGRWPGTGQAVRPAGRQALNLPVPRGFNDSELDLLLAEAVLPAAARFEPEAVVVTCGTDALAGDPLSGMELSNVALWDAVDALRGLGGRTVILGGGGYNPWTLSRCWAGLWARLSGREIPDRLPPAAAALLASLDCDLVEEDDRKPHWSVTLADPRNERPIRPEIRELAAAARS